MCVCVGGYVCEIGKKKGRGGREEGREGESKSKGYLKMM